MNEFHFLRPEWFWGFSVLLLLPFFIRRKGTQGGLWKRLCDGFLLKVQLISGTGKRMFLPLFLVFAAWTLTLFSLAGPAWRKLPQPAVKKGADTVYVMDISVLMTPTDVKPSRMERARFKMHDFLQKTKDGQNALILYGQSPFVAVPLTTDQHIIDSMLPMVRAGMTGGGMPDPATALEEAFKLLERSKSSDGRIIVLSGHLADETLSDVLNAAEKINSAGYTVSFLGVGTKDGAPLQLSDGSFLTHQGKPVLSSLSQKNMEKAAQAGGGSYQTVTLDERDINSLIKALPEKGGLPFLSEQEEMKADTWKDFGAILCVFILPFAALGFRKGWLGVFLFWMIFTPSSANAWSFSDLWTRSDRKEALAISAGEKPENPSVFKDKAWQGAAAYKAGDYSTAVSALAQAEDVEALYNQGNALAQTGRYQQAIETYKQVLKQNPDHEDAAFNKKYLEEQLKNNQQNQQQNQDQQQNQSKQQNQSEEEKQDQQNQQDESTKQQERRQNQDGQQQNQEQNKQEQSSDMQGQSQKEQERSTSVQKQSESEHQPQTEQKAPPEQKTEQDQEKQEQMQWLSVIEDDPSGLLRERIRRHNLIKGRRR